MRAALRGTDAHERAASVLRVVALGAWLCACQPDLVVGTRTCFADETGSVSAADPNRVSSVPVGIPWSTGFEHGFCEYRDLAGYCHVNTEAQHEIVDSPVHDGKFAAAFHVTGNDSRDALQARCVRQGTLPQSAYYGAWYYIPNYAANANDWNLFHFEGWNGTNQVRLWNVSIGSEDGELRLYVFDQIRGVRLDSTRRLALPIGSWVHIEFFLERSAEATGTVALYQDGEVLREEPNLVTDNTERGEWYLGNLADALTPPDSTLYVDDVTIRASR